MIGFNLKRKIGSFLNLSLLSLVLIGAISLSQRANYNASIDLSGKGAHSLNVHSSEVAMLLAKTDFELQIDGYFLNPQVLIDFKKLIFLYKKAGLKIKERYFDPDLNILESKKDGVDAKNVAILKFKSSQQKLYQFNEERITQALKFFLSDQKDYRIGVISGHGEPDIFDRSETGLHQMAVHLSGFGYKADKINLDKIDELSKYQLIALIGAQENLSIHNIRKLNEYILNSGSLLILSDALSPVDSINQLLQKVGIEIKYDFLVLRPEHHLSSKIGQNNALFESFSDESYIGSILGKRFESLARMPDSRSLDIFKSDQWHAKILIATTQDNVSVADSQTIEDLDQVDPSRLHSGQFILSSISEAKYHSGKVAVVGSSSGIRNSFYTSDFYRDFYTNLFHYLSGRDDLIIADKKIDSAKYLTVDTAHQVYILGGLSFLYPLAVLLFFIGCIVIRRYKFAV